MCPRRTFRRSLLAVLYVLLTGVASAQVTSEALRQRLDEHAAATENAGADALSAPAVQFAAPDLLQAFYQKRGFVPAWDDARARALIDVVRDAGSYGLSPSDYLLATLDALPALSTLDGAARIDADFALTESLLRYAYHRRFGKVDPRELDPSWNYARNFSAGGPYAALERILAASDLAAQVDAEVGHGAVYDALLRVLAQYRGYVAAGGWAPVPDGATLKPGVTEPRVAALRTRLAAEGFNAAAPADPNNFDEALQAALQEFQAHHGLATDGVAGARTLAEINVSAPALVDRLRVNLERLRWVLVERTPHFIAVNVAGFRVYYVQDDKVQWQSRVMVGKPYRQTPIFRADMKYLVLNPDWTVPPGILRKDKLPVIRRDPGYLAKQNMDVVDRSGAVVDPTTVDWSPGAPFPYLLRQRPGPTNALGRVKFIFPNPHFVFLHDTPSRELFEQHERLFSSGCIRVEHPLELAAILLRDEPAWSADALQKAVDSGVTRTVLLKEPLPVLLLYLTAIAFDDGRDYTFNRDAYTRDAAVLTALDAPFVYSPPEGLAAQ